MGEGKGCGVDKTPPIHPFEHSRRVRCYGLPPQPFNYHSLILPPNSSKQTSEGEGMGRGGRGQSEGSMNGLVGREEVNSRPEHSSQLSNMGSGGGGGVLLDG